MDGKSIELSTLPPPTYTDAVINESKGNINNTSPTQNEQYIQRRNEAFVQLLGEIQGTQRQLNANVFTREPMAMQCPHCQHNIQTKIVASAGSTTHMIFGMLCGMLCWCCACIPYLFKRFKDIKHYCPDCKGYIGKNRLTPKTETRCSCTD